MRWIRNLIGNQNEDSRSMIHDGDSGAIGDLGKIRRKKQKNTLVD